MPSPTAYRAGWLAEDLAAGLLFLKGWRIVERRWRPGRGNGGGEVDLIAAKDGVLVFVEVKRRADPALAAESVTAAQRARIVRAAEIFLARHPDFAGHDIRFDAVLVSPGKLPCHVTDAWRPES